MNNLGRLPAELISLILDHIDINYFYACALINKAFYKETTPLLWQQLVIGDSATLSKITTAMATSPRSPGEHVRYVSMGPFLTDAALLALIEHVPLLQKLELTRFQEDVTDASLQHVPRYCPHLTHLIVECRYETKDHERRVVGPTQRSMVALGQYCHQLIHVKLESCRGLDADLFLALSACPLIEHLTVDSCDLQDMKDPRIAKAAALHLAGMSCLKELKLWYHSFDHTVFMTTALHSRAGNIAWPHMTYLSLYICPTLDDRMAMAFIASHRYLQHLELRDSIITDATLTAMPEYLPDITVVVLDWSSRITSVGLRRLVTTAASAKLHHVECFGCGLFLDDFLPDANRHLMVTNKDLNSEIGSQEVLHEDENEVVRLYKGAFDGMITN